MDPLEIKIPGLAATFGTPLVLHAWIKQEVEQWQAFEQRLKSVRLPGLDQAVRREVNAWQQQLEDADRRIGPDSQLSTEGRAEAAGFIASAIGDLIERGRLFHAGVYPGSLLQPLSTTSVVSAAWMLLLLSPDARQFVTNSDSGQFWAHLPEFIRAISVTEPTRARERSASKSAERAEQHRLDAAAALEVVRGLLSSLPTEFSGALADTRREWSDAKEAFIEDAASARDDAAKRLKALEVTYDSHLKLAKPREYWDSKRETHRVAARRFGVAALAALGIGSLIVAGLLTGFVKDWFEAPAQWAWIVPIAVLGGPAFILLWILRILIRQYTDHTMRAEDARERSVMVETFLALARSESSTSLVAGEAHTALILSALFRAGPGLAPDDSPPATMLEALASFARPKG